MSALRDRVRGNVQPGCAGSCGRRRSAATDRSRSSAAVADRVDARRLAPVARAAPGGRAVPRLRRHPHPAHRAARRRPALGPGAADAGPGGPHAEPRRGDRLGRPSKTLQTAGRAFPASPTRQPRLRDRGARASRSPPAHRHVRQAGDGPRRRRCEDRRRRRRGSSARASTLTLHTAQRASSAERGKVEARAEAVLRRHRLRVTPDRSSSRAAAGRLEQGPRRPHRAGAPPRRRLVGARARPLHRRRRHGRGRLQLAAGHRPLDPRAAQPRPTATTADFGLPDSDAVIDLLRWLAAGGYTHAAA